MRHQAPVQTRHTLFLGDQSETLRQPGVFGAAVFERCLAQAGSDDLEQTGVRRNNGGEGKGGIVAYLVRIRQQGRGELGRARCARRADPARDLLLCGCLLLLGRAERFLERAFQPLVQDQVERCLDGAEVACAQALVQTAQAFLSQDLLHAVETVAVAAGSGGCLGPVELESGFDEPDRVGGCGGCDAGGDGCLCMNESRVLTVAEHLGADALAVSIDVELDGCGWDHAR